MNILFVIELGFLFFGWNLQEVSPEDILGIWNRLNDIEVFHLANINKITAKEQQKISGLLQNEHFLTWLPDLLQQIKVKMEVVTVNAYERLCCHLVAKTINCQSHTVLENVQVSMSRDYMSNFKWFNDALKAAAAGKTPGYNVEREKLWYNPVDIACRNYNSSGSDYDYEPLNFPFTKKGNVTFTEYFEARQEAVQLLLQFRLPLPPELIQMISNYI